MRTPHLEKQHFVILFFGKTYYSILKYCFNLESLCVVFTSLNGWILYMYETLQCYARQDCMKIASASSESLSTNPVQTSTNIISLLLQHSQGGQRGKHPQTSNQNYFFLFFIKHRVH